MIRYMYGQSMRDKVGPTSVVGPTAEASLFNTNASHIEHQPSRCRGKQAGKLVDFFICFDI